MDDRTEKRIVIESFTGGEDGHQLLGCYFVQHGDSDSYSFYGKDEKLKAPDVRVGSEFQFTLDDSPGIDWTLTLAEVDQTPDRKKMRGGWNDSRDPALADGTYQAEAGGAGEEEPNASSAYA